ncbi:hypothetical protein LSTR_LSTR000066 [Laodelphax striatellus]|uniref:Uncharacterized protein n=1 Tax=Laodelphax striatellus TaxID=195883 RepID=A0A482X6P6_LAOST|nr:hypothetical protein LSTR_LSTR000066 [Laodelphax striatellus]
MAFLKPHMQEREREMLSNLSSHKFETELSVELGDETDDFERTPSISPATTTLSPNLTPTPITSPTPTQASTTTPAPTKIIPTQPPSKTKLPSSKLSKALTSFIEEKKSSIRSTNKEFFLETSVTQ